MKNPSRLSLFCVLVPTLIVVFLATLPQLNVWLVKGSAWQGAYVASNYDEVAYSAYTNSIIDGRPRKNDPFVGRDNVEGETLFSIQFVPAFVTAWTAKLLGLSASSVFVLLNFLIAIFSSLAIFFLIHGVTGDDRFAAAGVVVVLLFGTAVAFQGELRHMVLGNYLCDFFPFLRRYQPGFAFPLFFVFCLFVYRSLTSEEGRLGVIYAAIAGGVFCVIVFSYFFLWTAAAAWLGVFALLWLLFRPEFRGRSLVRICVTGALALAAIVPFFVLLAGREKKMDDVQLLDLTRAPNLFELPEILGTIVVIGLVWLVRKGRVNSNSPAVLIAAAFAVTPFVLFNQQVLTGRSLQPVHYEIFIANYMILTAAMILLWLFASSTGELSSPKWRRAVVYLGVAAVIWGFVESSATARRNAGYEGLRDDSMAVLKYLHDSEPARPSAAGEYPTVLSTNLMVADFIPTVTSYRSLWNPHTNSAGGVDQKENRELFYRFMYFSGFGEADLARAIDEPLYEVVAALFGGGRALPELGGSGEKITAREKQAEIAKYRDYVSKFDAAHAYSPELKFIIVPAEAEPDLANLDRWYRRDGGQTFGLFRLYRLTRR
jgi:hypothetical protein